MTPKLPKPTLPSWMNKGEVGKLAVAAHKWFSLLREWALLPITQLDPMTCNEPVLDLVAWQRDIQRFKDEPLNIYRLRVRYAYANARDAGSVEGFKNIFKRLGIGYVEIEERMDGMDWDVINISLSDTQLAENESLLTTLIQHYGRTCRRYGWKVITTLPIEIQVAEFSNDHVTESTAIELLTDTIHIQAVEFSNDHVTESASIEFLTDTIHTQAVEFSNDNLTESASIEFLTDTIQVQVIEFSNDHLSVSTTMEKNK
jgi:phage tail P2-like protein